MTARAAGSARSNTGRPPPLWWLTTTPRSSHNAHSGSYTSDHSGVISWLGGTPGSSTPPNRPCSAAKRVCVERVVEVVEQDLRDAGAPTGRGRAEVGEPAVVRAAARPCAARTRPRSGDGRDRARPTGRTAGSCWGTAPRRRCRRPRSRRGAASLSQLRYASEPARSANGFWNACAHSSNSSYQRDSR